MSSLLLKKPSSCTASQLSSAMLSKNEPLIMYCTIYPAFLQRCLHYMIQANRKKRIQLTVSLSRGTNTDHNIFPLYVLLATPTSDSIPLEGHSPIYRFSRACLLTSFTEFASKDHNKATFTIPDVKNIAATSRACNLSIILIRCVSDSEGQVGENNCSGDHVEASALRI
ncbi:unnamed protein product [Triticum turgidum subsp. durum]|uniref:DUF7651 domain-containing protein n=1 Tax=Triticum turgidum subsp. durum TaxID=4567 RepID=A0A9R1NFV7_TRITD|nr:unnamed protein product [Triticum turgidum subsp. durum]